MCKSSGFLLPAHHKWTPSPMFFVEVDDELPGTGLEKREHSWERAPAWQELEYMEYSSGERCCSSCGGAVSLCWSPKRPCP